MLHVKLSGWSCLVLVLWIRSIYVSCALGGCSLSCWSRISIHVYDLHNLQTICVTVNQKRKCDTYAFLWCGPSRRGCWAPPFLCCWLPGLWTHTPPRDSSQWQWLTAAFPRAAQELRDIRGITFHQSPGRSAIENKPGWWCVIFHFMCAVWKVYQLEPLTLFYLLSKLHIHTIYILNAGWNKLTSSNSLPPEREGCPGLDGEAEDGAVIVNPRAPGEQSSGLRHMNYLTVHRGAWGT